MFQVQTENYATIRVALLEIIAKLEDIKTIIIEEREFKIKWEQGGDLKWLANCNGINAANSHKPCVWCTWDSSKPLDIAARWPIDGRTHETGAKKLNSDIQTASNDGYVKVPLMKFIQFKQSIVDTLHLCLRVTDRMLAKLIDHLSFLDGNDGSDLSKRPLFNKYKEFLELDCNLKNPVMYDKNKDTWKMRSLNEPERLKILSTMKEKRDLLDVFGFSDAKLSLFNYILIEFLNIYTFIKLDHTKNFDEEALREKLIKWLGYYLRCTDNEKLTPYLHILVFHIPQFITEYKNLSLYCMQALERLNSVTKRNFFRQTNRRPLIAMRQLLNKANRNELY